MGFYFTLKQIPELRGFTPAQIAVVSTHCVQPVFKRSIIPFVIIMGFLNDLVAIVYKNYFGHSMDGGHVLAIFGIAAIGSVAWILIIHAISRRTICRFLQTSRASLDHISTPNQKLK